MTSLFPTFEYAELEPFADWNWLFLPGPCKSRRAQRGRESRIKVYMSRRDERGCVQVKLDEEEVIS